MIIKVSERERRGKKEEKEEPLHTEIFFPPHSQWPVRKVEYTTEEKMEGGRGRGKK